MHVAFRIPANQLAIRADPIHWQRLLTNRKLAANHILLQIKDVYDACRARQRHKSAPETLIQIVLQSEATKHARRLENRTGFDLEHHLHRLNVNLVEISATHRY